MRRYFSIATGTAIIAVSVGAAGYFYIPERFLNAVPRDNSVSTSTTPLQVEAYSVSFRVLDTGMHAAGISAQKNYAVYSEADFAKLWKMAHGTDGAVLPKIDFSKEYVIGVFAGQKPTGGHAVTVASVTDKGSVRTVALTLTKPGADCMVTQALTNPYQIVVVPTSTASLAHTDTEVSKACN